MNLSLGETGYTVSAPQNGGREANLARRRHQRGCLFIRGTRCKVWIGQWREDILQSDGTVRRIIKKEVLSTLRETPTKRLAERLLETRVAHVNSMDYRACKVTTFGAFVELWRERVLKLQKPSTVRASKSGIKCHLLPVFGKQSLETINQEQLQAFVASASQSLSKKTIFNILGTLRSILDTARKWGYRVGTTDVSDLSFQSQITTKRSRHLTADQVRKILCEAEQPWRTLFLIAGTTGMRAGEVLGLKISDLDFDNQLINVSRSAWYGQAQTPKTQTSVRVLPMPPVLAKELKEYLANNWRSNDGGFLFTTRNNRPPSSNKVVTERLWPILDKLKIARCGLHAFRHANSSLLVSEGAPVTVAQAQLGHSDPRITLAVYSHVVPAQHREYAERVANKLLAS